MKKDKSCKCGCGRSNACGTGGAVYGLGFVGAVIYYISQASTFGGVLVAILKALVWPAFLVYDALRFLGA